MKEKRYIRHWETEEIDIFVEMQEKKGNRNKEQMVKLLLDEVRRIKRTRDYR